MSRRTRKRDLEGKTTSFLINAATSVVSLIAAWKRLLHERTSMRISVAKILQSERLGRC